MQKLSVLSLMGILSLIGQQPALPVLLQQPAAQGETAQPDPLLPPRVERVASRATLLRWGIPLDEVLRIMGPAAEIAIFENAGVELRVLGYRFERRAVKITVADGRVSGIALDIVAADDPELPVYSRSVWPGMHRMAVLRMIGAPTEDHFGDGFGVKLEHMVFERSGQPDLSIFLVDGRVATKKIGRAFRPDILDVSLPLAPTEADLATDGQSDRPSNAQIRVGMSAQDVQTLFGAPKHSVSYAVMGQPAEYRIYETGRDRAFTCFSFVDDVLVGFSDGCGFPLEQILNGG